MPKYSGAVSKMLSGLGDPGTRFQASKINASCVSFSLRYSDCNSAAIQLSEWKKVDHCPTKLASSKDPLTSTSSSQGKRPGVTNPSLSVESANLGRVFRHTFKKGEPEGRGEYLRLPIDLLAGLCRD